MRKQLAAGDFFHGTVSSDPSILTKLLIGLFLLVCIWGESVHGQSQSLAPAAQKLKKSRDITAVYHLEFRPHPAPAGPQVLVLTTIQGDRRMDTVLSKHELYGILFSSKEKRWKNRAQWGLDNGIHQVKRLLERSLGPDMSPLRDYLESDHRGLSQDPLRQEEWQNLPLVSSPDSRKKYPLSLPTSSSCWQSGRHQLGELPLSSSATGAGERPRPVFFPVKATVDSQGQMKRVVFSKNKEKVLLKETAGPMGPFSKICKKGLDYKEYRPQEHMIFAKKMADYFATDKLRVRDLAFDPDHGSITKTSILEAYSGLRAELEGILPAPIVRGGKSIEFLDGEGRPWDVKTPPSFEGKVSVKEVLQSIVKKLRRPYFDQQSQRFLGVHILLDTSFLREEDEKLLMDKLRGELSSEEWGRVQRVCTPISLFF